METVNGLRDEMEIAPAVRTLADKVAYLSRPESYAEGTSAVEIVETHMSYVFLIDRLVYKLKKPVRYPLLDFSTRDVCSAAHTFDQRLQQNVIVEGHGDLRREHVCLAAEPVFIDCLEFNRDLRIVDPADELASLAMECELLGAGDIGRAVFDTYASVTGDAPGIALTRFYRAQRALLRAKLAAWHLEDGVSDGTRAKWIARAQAYLWLAKTYCSSRETSLSQEHEH